MAPVTRSSKKKELELPNNPSKSDSSRGIKRSAGDRGKKKTEEKRRKTADEETETDEKSENDLAEDQEELIDSSLVETSFMDLPDDVHKNISGFLDLPSRMKLRLNKRLDRLQLSVENKMNRIRFEIKKKRSQLIVGKHRPLRSSTLAQREKGLRLLALNTTVDWILIAPNFQPSEEQSRIIDALFQFNANRLMIRDSKRCNLSHLTLPSFLTLAQNVRDVEIGVKCTSLSPNDFCAIRKTMLDRGCKMKSFKMTLSSEGKKAFLEECFGMTISHCLSPLHGTMYQTGDDSLEMYRIWGNVTVALDHFEGDLHTSIDDYRISFTKREVIKKPHDKFKIKWNHMYGDN